MRAVALLEILAASFVFWLLGFYFPRHNGNPVTGAHLLFAYMPASYILGIRVAARFNFFSGILFAKVVPVFYFLAPIAVLFKFCFGIAIIFTSPYIFGGFLAPLLFVNGLFKIFFGRSLGNFALLGER